MSQVTIDIGARIVGYEASLNKLQARLEHVDIGSNIGKQLSSAIDDAAEKLKALEKNPTPVVSSNNQINKVTKQVNDVGLAIQKVADLMRQVGLEDLNLSSLGDDFVKLQTLLTSVETELSGELTAGLQNFVTESEDVKRVFEDILHVDTKGMDPSGMFEALTEGAQQAAKEVEEAETQITKAQENLVKKQSELADLQQNPIFADKNFVNDIRKVEKQYSEWEEKLRQTMSNGLTGELNYTSKDANKLLDTFFSGLSKENVGRKILEIRKNISDATGKAPTDIYKILFGEDLGKGGNPQAIGNALMSTGFMNNLRQQLTAKLNELGGDLSDQELGTLKRLINEGSLEKAAAQTIKDYQRIMDKAQGQLHKTNQEVLEATANVENAKSNKTTAVANQELINIANEALEAKYQEVLEQNQNLQERINLLERLVNFEQDQTLNYLHNGARQDSEDVSTFMISKDEADAYSKKLDEVHEREQLIGKIEGVVQRWFSIYAAIRMVGNAIRDVISTISELDATITEIAIVTDMSQSDLWGQMDSYVDMAEKYASSISGVYKVSQLYYQQGLQTSDVMALTEQTLKMARISGLDYATATDYMTNAIRSFKMEMTDAQNVVDVYSAVAARSATDTTELANAMSKTASSAEAVGSSFENTTAMMAVMIEATRESAENIGSAMKSIISRLK